MVSLSCLLTCVSIASLIIFLGKHPKSGGVSFY